MKFLALSEANSFLELFSEHHVPIFFTQPFHAYEKNMGNHPGFIIDENKNIIAPVKIRQTKWLRILQFLYFPLKENERLDEETEKTFFEQAMIFISEQLNIDRIQQPLTLYCVRQAPIHSRYCPFGIYSIDLTLPENVIFSRFSESTRRQIRNAFKASAEIKDGASELTAFYDLYHSTMKRQRLWAESLSNLKTFYHTPGMQVICAVGYHCDLPYGAAFIPFTSYAAYYYYGGSAVNLKVPGMMKATLWDCMRVLKRRGVKLFVLGGARIDVVAGSKYENLQFFKERFAPYIEEGFLWKKDLHSLRCQLYDKGVKIKNRLNGIESVPDIIDSYLKNHS
jgi:hypothetical protein